MKRKCDDVCASLLDDARVVGDYRRLLFVIILASSRLEEDDLRNCWAAFRYSTVGRRWPSLVDSTFDLI